MTKNVAISVQNLSKTYKVKQSANTLRNYLGQALLKRKVREKEVLKDISFDIYKGSCVGIIGNNGAGKSTLFKILSRIVWPSKGKIYINGSLSAMLEVGTGFYPDLSGRENIFLSGALLGMSKQDIQLNMSKIIEFSGIGDFIDTPVRYYSSGMYVRLGFSISAFLNQDILLIDEILAVGDSEFKSQSISKIEECIKKEGKTVLLVSHDLPILQELCPKSLLLENGRLVMHDKTELCLSKYLNKEVSFNNIFEFSDVNLSEIKINGSSDNKTIIKAGGTLSIQINLELKSTIKELFIRFQIRKEIDNIAILNNMLVGEAVYSAIGNYTVECTIPALSLNVGDYSIDLEISDTDHVLVDMKSFFKVTVVESSFFITGLLPSIKRGPFLMSQVWKIKAQ